MENGCLIRPTPKYIIQGFQQAALPVEESDALGLPAQGDHCREPDPRKDPFLHPVIIRLLGRGHPVEDIGLDNADVPVP